MKNILVIFVMIALSLITTESQARIKLVTLPERSNTTIRLDNPTATLIAEERTLTLQKGLNKVDFAWNGVSIDPDSIHLEMLDHPGEVKLLNVSFPPNENALVWEITSPNAAQERVRVSYLLSNIDRLMTYKAVADHDETKVNFKNDLVLRNFSGEDFTNARFILDYGDAFERSIQHEETKKLAFLNVSSMPIEKVWHWDSLKQTWDPEKVDENVGIPVTYKMKNDKEHSLGNFALWGGKIRVYQDDGKGGQIILGEDSLAMIPTGEEMEAYIGDSRDIVVTQRQMSDTKVNVKRNNFNQEVLFDRQQVVTAKMENFKDKKAVLTMTQHIPGEWEMKQSNLKYTVKDANTIEYKIELAPNSKQELTMNYLLKNMRY
jgi:hypothetical protein